MGRYDLADQRAFASGQAVYAVSDAAQAVSLTGPDALKLVSALTTLPPGPAGPPPSGAEALALDSQGHILFGLAIRPAEDGDGLLVLTDGPAEELAELINSRRFRLRALAAPRPEVKVLVTPRRVEGFGLAAFEDGWPGPNEDSGLIWPRYALDRPHPGAALTGLAAHVYDPRADWSAPDRLEAMGYRQIDAAVLEGLRIAAWRPLASREAADSKTLPHELDWLRATTPIGSGCYPGQETVARIVNLGKPPRRLVMLHLDGSDAALPAPGAEVWAAGADEARGTGRAGSPPAPGAEVWAAGPGAADGGRPDRGWTVPASVGAGLDPAASVGRITSVGLHYELGPIALALVKRSLPEDAALAVAAEGAPGGSIAAAQTRIVPASGESDARPAPGRLGLGRGRPGLGRGRPGLGQGRPGLGQGRPGRGGLGPGRLGPG